MSIEAATAAPLPIPVSHEAGAEQLVRYAQRLLAVVAELRPAAPRLGPSKVSKLVRRWTILPDASRPPLRDWLLRHVDLAAQRSAALAAALDEIGPPPPWRDHTGENAVRNVMHPSRRRHVW